MAFDINNAPDGAITTGTAASATTILGPFDTTNFLSASVQLTGTWVGTVVCEGSGDETNPTNWVALPSVNALGAVVVSASANTVLVLPLTTRWFRVRMSAYTSGTVAVGAMFATDALAPTQNNSSVVVSSGAITATLAGSSTVALSALATGTGATPSRITTGASGAIKASAGRTYGWLLQNTNVAVRYMQLYNKATAGIPGTDTPYLTIPLPLTSQVTYDTSVGLTHATGISWAITTDVAGTTAGASGDIVGTVFFI
jgi:hypothetical protein